MTINFSNINLTGLVNGDLITNYCGNAKAAFGSNTGAILVVLYQHLHPPAARTYGKCWNHKNH